MLHMLCIGAERQYREVIFIEMILDVKHCRESGAGRDGFVPCPIGILMLPQPADTILDGGAIDLTGSDRQRQVTDGKLAAKRPTLAAGIHKRGHCAASGNG